MSCWYFGKIGFLDAVPGIDIQETGPNFSKGASCKSVYTVKRAGMHTEVGINQKYITYAYLYAVNNDESYLFYHHLLAEIGSFT